MKLKKILKEITKLHEENNDMKIQLLRKQRSLDCVNKERDDLFLENKRLKAENCKLLIGNKGLKEDLKTFALQLGHSVEEVQYAPGEKKMGIFKDEAPEEIKEKEVRQIIENTFRETTEEFSEQGKAIAEHIVNLFKEDPEEIDDIEDELKEASNSNKSNPCQADEEVGDDVYGILGEMFGIDESNPCVFTDMEDRGYVNIEIPSPSHDNSLTTPSAFYLERISSLKKPFIYTNSDLMFVGFYSDAQSCINNLKVKVNNLEKAEKLIEHDCGFESVGGCLSSLKENGFNLLHEKLELIHWYDEEILNVIGSISTQLFDITQKLKQDIEYLEKHAT